MSFVVDRVDVFGRVREHLSDDGARSLCGQELTAANSKLPAGNLRCTRCLRRDARPRADSLADLRPSSYGAELALDLLARTIANLDGDARRADRIRRLAAHEHEHLAELRELQREAVDITSIRLFAMAALVLRGTRNLGQLHELCEDATASRSAN